MYKQVKQLSWQACIGNMHKDLGSIPDPNNFLYFLFLPQIQCKSLSHAYHAPSIINQWMQQSARCTRSSLKDYHAPQVNLHIRSNKVKRAWVIWAQNFSNIPPTLLLGPSLTFFYLFLFFNCF